MYSHTTFFRLAGLAAFIATFAYLASLGMTITAVGAGWPIAFIAIIVNALISVAVFAALYLTHRSESPALSLIALFTAAIGALDGLFIDPSKITPVVGVVSALYGIGALLFGWLGMRSPGVPLIAGMGALGAGIIGRVMAVIAFAGVDAQTFSMSCLPASGGRLRVNR